MPSQANTATTAPDPTAQHNEHELVSELMGGLRETAQSVMPWFLQQMPPVYFQGTDKASQLVHLRAIIAAKASGQETKLTLRTDGGSQWTMMRPRDYPGVLAELVHELPLEPALRAAKIHTAADGQLVLNVFEFGEAPPFDIDQPQQAARLEEAIQYAKANAADWPEQDIVSYCKRCTADYVLDLTPIRLHKHWRICQNITGTDGTVVQLELEKDQQHSRIIVGVGNSRTRTMLERVATRLSQYKINIHRAYLDVVNDGANGHISLLGFVVQDEHDQPLDPSSELWKCIRKDLLRIKWIDPVAIALADRNKDLDLLRAEVAIGLSNLVHQVLVKTNPYAFARDRLHRLVERHLQQSRQIVDLFLDRFDTKSPLDDVAFRSRVQNLRMEIESEVDHEDARLYLNRLIDAVDATLRTNVYLEERYSLALRIDPTLLTTSERSELPYGVFFVHGRSFNAFHVRFRDIARGGVRAVRPIGADQFAREAERLYDEAYGLAFAQQLKNKDIPEGGAKAVILVEPGEYIPRCFKAFADGILDLITPDSAVQAQIVDRIGKPELLYLGPDENITPDMINWIVDRARRRQYGLPNSFMSSKPGAGINHKEYGVTSEGVTVFLDAALHAAGIDPKTQPFTVKITGGPDGDVAGNEIKILHREYGSNARVVGIADGSGSAEDPDGLDQQELLRLVAASEPIAEFDRSKLGEKGRVVTVDEPEGFNLRNTMHHRVVADAFVPAGGRPRTIHQGNWRQFLKTDGSPSSKVIVEGANLFLTPEARQELSDAGALIFKDSSANKCGVICSSFEIGASMVLSVDEFLSIKETFVNQVLTKLRELARQEADLLLREHARQPHIPLPETSVRLSRIIIRASDAIEASLADVDLKNDSMVKELVIGHLPTVLMETAGSRLWSELPEAYIRWIVASSLAARIVYREGLEFLEGMPMAAIGSMTRKYFAQERETNALIDEILQSDMESRCRIAALLERGGTRAGLGDS